MRPLAVFVWLATLCCMFPASALSRVILDDAIAVKAQKVMLRAETKGKLFSKGGELVEFFVDGKSIGKNLSGGDGVAFKQFTPVKTGLHGTSAKSGEEEDSGLLLSLEIGSSIVFVDVEGSLLKGLFSKEPRSGSQDSIKEIHGKFPIVFLQTSFVGARAVKAWLKENEFVELPVVSWREGAVFHEILEKGLKIKAIIGGPNVIESAREYEPLVFSFEAIDDIDKVQNWEEIRKKLK